MDINKVTFLGFTFFYYYMFIEKILIS